MLMPMLADLHSHTIASDGALGTGELMAIAEAAKIDMLAITDHDTVAGLAAFRPDPSARCRIIPGIEFSTTWRKTAIHVLGLNIDINNPALAKGIERQQSARHERATVIAERLAKLGLRHTLEGATQLAGNAGISRVHFANYLVESAQVKSMQEAYGKYLGPGKRGDVKSLWASLTDVIEWIDAAGGISVLAHPAKYRLTNLKLEELAGDFRAAGGQGLEVLSGKQDTGLTRRLGKLANRMGLLASCGSDFHRPGQGWAELGAVEPLPDGCRPVWEHW
jgi:predicted metal-dependent phosphoesterase TrpH